MKTCSKCKEDKPIEEFHRRRDAPDGRYAYCRTCARRRNVAYKAANREAHYAARRAYYRNNREAVCSRQKDYARRSPQQALTSSLWRALKRQPTQNPITGKELMQLWRDQGGRCALSGIMMTWATGAQGGKLIATSLTIDRIDGALGYEKGNVRLLCHCVNSFRGRMTDAETLKILDAFHAHVHRGEPV